MARSPRTTATVRSSSHSGKPFTVLSLPDAIDHLRVAYRRGLLVPFVGSGLSAGAVPMWPDLIRELATDAGFKDLRFGKHPTEKQLIVASEKLVAALHAAGKHAFATSLQKALRDSQVSRYQVPAATRHLASVWWPLTLTTNYDSLYLKAFNARHSHGNRPHYRMGVVGRTARDCHTALTSLSVAQRPILWPQRSGVDLAHLGCPPIPVGCRLRGSSSRRRPVARSRSRARPRPGEGGYAVHRSLPRVRGSRARTVGHSGGGVGLG